MVLRIKQHTPPVSGKHWTYTVVCLEKQKQKQNQVCLSIVPTYNHI